MQEMVTRQKVSKESAVNIRARPNYVEFSSSSGNAAHEAVRNDAPIRFESWGNLRNKNITVPETGITGGHRLLRT